MVGGDTDTESGLPQLVVVQSLFFFFPLFLLARSQVNGLFVTLFCRKVARFGG